VGIFLFRNHILKFHQNPSTTFWVRPILRTNE